MRQYQQTKLELRLQVAFAVHTENHWKWNTLSMSCSEKTCCCFGAICWSLSSEAWLLPCLGYSRENLVVSSLNLFFYDSYKSLASDTFHPQTVPVLLSLHRDRDLSDNFTFM